MLGFVFTPRRATKCETRLLMGAPSSMNVNSDEAGTWHYVVDCATCKETIPFKQAASPEDQPIVHVPTMKVRCPHCHNDHTYAAELISRRQLSE
jgi:DNA-directed RNA polymerase subunit RPC12/RpoP